MAAPDLEVQIPAIAPEENAFVWFEKAGLALVDKFPGRSQDSVMDTWDGDLVRGIGTQYEKWDPVFATEVLKANASVFPCIEKGLSCQRYRVPQAMSCRDHLTYLQKCKKLITLLCLKSKQAQLTGDFTGAAQAALQAFHLGQVVTDNSRNINEWWVGTLAEQTALLPMAELATEARTPNPILVEFLEALDRRQPEKIDEAYRNTVRGQYVLRLQMLTEFHAGGPTEFADWVRFVPYMLKANMTSRRLADYCRNQIKRASLPYPQIVADLSRKFKEPVSITEKLMFYGKPNSVGMVIFAEEESVLTRFLCKKFPLLMNLAALRLKIALRLYEQKHGQLPDDLSALVPEFMPMVPKDPFDDQPFRYSKEKKQVWSIGEDGVDDGGVAENGRIMASGKFGFDAVMPLGTREMKPNLTPPPPTSTNPSTSGAK